MNRIVLLFALVLGVSTSSWAQQSLLLNFMDDAPQQLYANPAHLSRRSFSIGIPGLAGMYIRHENTLFNPRHMFENSSDGTSFRTEHFLDQVRDYNYLGLEGATDLLVVTFATGPSTQWSFSLRDRLQGRLVLPGDMIRFPFIGNGNFESHGNVLDFSGLGVYLNHYREAAFGWHHRNNSGLTIGVRGKLLFGSENIDTKVSNAVWTTDTDTYDWNFSGEMDVYTSGIYNLTDTIDDNHLLENGKVMTYLFNVKNRGLGVDVGVEKRVTDKLSLNAAVTDLGFIRWKDALRSLETDKNEFSFIGVEFTEDILTTDGDIADSLDQQLNALWDEAERDFNFNEGEQGYRSATLARFQVGASYHLFGVDTLSAGRLEVLFQSEVFRGRLRPTYTLAYVQNFGRWFTGTLAYSVIDREHRNLGVGLRLNAGPLQLYVLTDNVLAVVLNPLVFTDENGAEESRISYPSFARTTQLQFGLNLTF